MAVKKNSSKNKPAFSFFSNSFDEIFSGKFSDVRHFSPFARFLPLYSSAVIRKVPWQVGVSDSHLFGLYQLNIECRLLFYQLLIPDKGERASVILPLWVWELGFPKKKKMETWNLREGPARFQNTVSLPQPSSCCENAVKVNAICALQHRLLRHTRHFHSPHYNGDLEAILRERPHSALDSR